MLENKQVFGNLVLGGYDQSRFKPTSFTFQFGASDANALTVGVQSILAENTLLGTASFTATGGNHLSVIDSTVPHLWLPQTVCDQMETALGLTYDPQSDLYLVNDTMHAQLVSKNPTFTFKLGNTQFDNGNSTNIVLPYAAFDLKVGWPVYSTDQNYFPIRRASSSAEYTLGRTLLQESYLVVDYERRNFTVGQAVFPDPLPTQHIVTITSTEGGTKKSSGISTGAIVGIAVAAGVIVLGLIAVLIWWMKRGRHSKSKKAAELEAISKRQSAGKYDNKYQPGEDGAVEIGAEAGHQVVELPGGSAYGPRKDRKDAHGPHNFASELPSPAPVFEMEGDSSHNGPPSPYVRGPSPYNREPSPYQPSPTR
jgi:hypothetical protein